MKSVSTATVNFNWLKGVGFSMFRYFQLSMKVPFTSDTVAFMEGVAWRVHKHSPLRVDVVSPWFQCSSASVMLQTHPFL